VKYPMLERAPAQEILRLRATGETPDVDSMMGYRGDGQLIDDSFIEDLRKDLVKIRKKFPAQLLARDAQGGKFEADASPVVHRHMRNVSGAALADADFWRWLAVVHFSDLVDWRHAPAKAQAHPNNYGIGNTRRNLLYRMYIRAEVAYDAGASDPYHLVQFGDKDLWESHIIAVKIGNSRTIVRSLMSYLYPSASKGKCRFSTKEVRALASRLTRLRANVVFEMFDAKEASAVIAREAERARAVLASANA
jgi:hypothetical protein